VEHCETVRVTFKFIQSFVTRL